MIGYLIKLNKYPLFYLLFLIFLLCFLINGLSLPNIN